MSGSVFRLEGVSYSYGSSGRKALDSVTLDIEEGSRTAILGANGSGKSTMFYSMDGVYRPSEGQVLHRGKPISYTVPGLTCLRADVSVVLQNPDEQMFSSTVEDDVAFGAVNTGATRKDIDRRIDGALRLVRMTEYRRTPLHQLSGGQRKRVSIAGALAVRPRVLIMDEPTAGLDPQAYMEVMELAERLRLMGVTLIISTHDVDLAYSWADKVHVMNAGKHVYEGSSEGFYRDPAAVRACGLFRPAVYEMNDALSRMSGSAPDPYPRTVGEYLAKFGGSGKAGTVYCVSCPSDGEGVAERYAEEVSRAGEDSRRGITGMDSRDAVSAARLKADFYFGGIDSCLAEAVLGRDSVLIFDKVYAPLVKERAERIRSFGADVELEGDI